MKKASIRDLHIRTSELVREAAGGAVIERDIAKYYVDEPDAAAVRRPIWKALDIRSSAWAAAERPQHRGLPPKVRLRARCGPPRDRPKPRRNGGPD